MDIEHDKQSKRFYIEINGQIGDLKYRGIDDETLEYYSAFVPVNLRNKGIAAQIVEYALEYAKDNDYSVKPTCSYVKKYLINHHMD